MRKVSIVIAICFVLALALSLTAQVGDPLDAGMKQVAPAWTSLQAKIDAGDAAGVVRGSGLQLSGSPQSRTRFPDRVRELHRFCAGA